MLDKLFKQVSDLQKKGWKYAIDATGPETVVDLMPPGKLAIRGTGADLETALKEALTNDFVDPE